MDSSTLRILDAAANRANEGLRVVEDFLRFAIDDRHLTGVCKQLRHDLNESLSWLPSSAYCAARDTRADVGTSIVTTAESRRADSTAVVAANFKRVEQSLRSLEEYGKVIDPEFGASFEQLRYRIYTLERAADITRSSADQLAEARLYVLIDGCDSLD